MNDYLVTYRTDKGYQQLWVKADGWLRGDRVFMFEQYLETYERTVFTMPTSIIRSVARSLPEADALLEVHREGDVPWPLGEGPRVLASEPEPRYVSIPQDEGPRVVQCLGCGTDAAVRAFVGGWGNGLSLMVFACPDCVGSMAELVKGWLREVRKR